MLQLGSGGLEVTSTGTGLTIGGTANAAQSVDIDLRASQTWRYAGLSSGSGILVRNAVTVSDGGNYTLTLETIDANNPNNTISGAIGNSSGTLNLTMNPGNVAGRWNLSGVNTYTGVTNIVSGALGISNGSALGASGAGQNTIVADGASLFTRSGVTVNEHLTLNGGGVSGTGALRAVSGNSLFQGPITVNTTASNVRIGADAGTNLTLGTNADFTTNGSGRVIFSAAAVNATINVNGSLGGTVGVDAPGPGLVVFGNDAKAYTGTTNIGAGTFRLNTALTGTSAFTVGAGGVLQGHGGFINGSITTTINGTSGNLATLSPGAGTLGSMGGLTTGILSLGQYSRMIVDMNFDASGGGTDRVIVPNFTIANGAALAVNLSGSNPVIGSSLVFISTAGVWGPTNLFSVDGVAIADEGTFTSAGNTYRIDYNYNGSAGEGVALTLLGIPEPGSIALAGFAGAMGMLRRRRKSVFNGSV